MRSGARARKKGGRRVACAGYSSQDSTLRATNLPPVGATKLAISEGETKVGADAPEKPAYGAAAERAREEETPAVLVWTRRTVL